MKFSLFTQLMLDTAESCWMVLWGKGEERRTTSGDGEWRMGRRKGNRDSGCNHFNPLTPGKRFKMNQDESSTKWEFGLKAHLKRKELARSSSRWEGHDFLVFLRLKFLVSWMLLRLILILSLSFRHHLRDLFALHRLTIKLFKVTETDKWNKTPAHSWEHMGATGISGLS